MFQSMRRLILGCLKEYIYKNKEPTNTGSFLNVSCEVYYLFDQIIDPVAKIKFYKTER